MNQSFAREFRLLHRSEFDRVFAAPDRRSSDRYFTVLGRCRSGSSRLGLTVPKRAVARAHERNRLKRLAREGFRLSASRDGIDMVLIAKHSAQFASNEELFASLARHLQRMK